MPRCLLPACLVWVVCAGMVTLVTTCSPGWFGDDCKLMCHCNSTDNCNKDGTCINNATCAIPYFGPACQYVNILSWDSAVPASQAYLTDNNDETCNPDTNASSVSVSLSTAYHLKWFRIHSNDKRRLLQFSIKLNDTDSVCENERRNQISDVIVEVMCEISIPVSKVEIEGPVAPHICSLYFNIGRNVALKQTTRQSLNYTSDGSLGLSSNAVDGNTNQNYSSGSCTRTGGKDTLAYWSLTYSQEVSPYFIRIYNRDSYMYRLTGFTIMFTDSSGRIAAWFEDKSGQNQSVYNIVLSPSMPVSSITLYQADTTLDSPQHILTLCEMETYGDVDCLEGNFGFYCEHICNCSDNEVCSPIIGCFTPHCKSGFFGTDCTLRCMEGCSESGCDTISGQCTGCNPGLTGINCTDECPPGKFGESCTSQCPGRCIDTCNVTTGECPCPQGFTGLYCRECLPTLYGQLCDKMCPVHCLNNTCDVHGKCVSCLSGFSGEACAVVSESSSPLIKPIIISAVTLLSFTFFVYLCLMKKRKTEHYDPELPEC